MEFRELNKELNRVKASFLSRKQTTFLTRGDNFTIEVTYGKIGSYSSTYMLTVKYNNYSYFQMSKEPYEIWHQIENGIKIIETILRDPQAFKNNKEYEELIKKASMDEIIGKVYGRC